MKTFPCGLIVLYSLGAFACSANTVERGFNYGDNRRALKKLQEYHDLEYELSGSGFMNRHDVCEAAAPLRQYVLKDPILSAEASVSRGVSGYLAIRPADEILIPSLAMPVELKRRVLEAKNFSLIDSFSDNIACGEQFFLQQYVKWYVAAYNSTVYKLAP